MDKAKSYTFTKAELAKLKAGEKKLSPEKRREISKALVDANTQANTPKKRRKG